MARFAIGLPKKQVRRNTLWNIFGQGFPLLLAAFFIPRLISEIGIDRFGALTIIWAILTYFGFFDFGIGRSLTQLLAHDRDKSEEEESVLIWTVSILLALIGIVMALIIFPLAPFVVIKLLRLHGNLQIEMTGAIRELGVCLPFLLHSLALKGILEAKRRFDLSNLIRLPVGLFTYGAPILILPFSHNLAAIVAVMLSGRLLAWVWNLVAVFRLMPYLGRNVSWDPGRLTALLRLGGWFSVTNIISCIIDGLDRFLISALLSISFVAFYTTPYELITKLWIVSAGLGGAIFPEFAVRFRRDPKEAQVLYMRGVKYLFAVMFPLVLIVTAYAREGLGLWLNPTFAITAGPILQWLAFSMLLSGISQVAFAFLLGIGRPDALAKLYFLALPVHAGLLYLLLKTDGIQGAAIASVIRFVIDFLALLFISGSILKFKLWTYGKILWPVGIASCILFVFHFPIAPVPKAALVVVILLAQIYVSWTFILEQGDKATILRMLGREKIA